MELLWWKRRNRFAISENSPKKSTWPNGKSDTQDPGQENEIWPNYLMVHTQKSIRPGKWDTEFSGILRYKINHLMVARRPDIVIIKKGKENLSNSRLWHTGGPQSENQRKRKQRQVLRACQRTKKLWNMKMTVTPIIIGVSLSSLQKLDKESSSVGNGWMNVDNLNYWITKIC